MRSLNADQAPQANAALAAIATLGYRLDVSDHVRERKHAKLTES